MLKSSIAGMAILAVSLLCSSVAEAQERAERRPSILEKMRSRRNSDESPGATADDVGKITGDERFLRDAREATDFVGSDSREGGFVGGQSAADGEIRSAIEGALVRRATDPAINRMRSPPQLQTGMYAPRLRLGFTPTTLPAPAIETAMIERLSVSSAIRSTVPLEVSMAGRTATLRGTVGSEHEKRLAGLMVLFEPGISKVQNELAVTTPESNSPVELPAPAPQKKRPSDEG